MARKKYQKQLLHIALCFLTIFLFFTVTTLGKQKKDEQVTYKILVDVEVSQLYVLKNGQPYKEYKCSGGKPSTPSPIGTWTIVTKGKWGEGFGGSWMGFNVPWGKFGIHGNEDRSSVGWPSSHGCIRMYNDEVAELYQYIPIRNQSNNYRWCLS